MSLWIASHAVSGSLLHAAVLCTCYALAIFPVSNGFACAGQPSTGEGQLCSTRASPHHLLCRVLPNSLCRVHAGGCQTCSCQQQNLLCKHLSALLAAGMPWPTRVPVPWDSPMYYVCACCLCVLDGPDLLIMNSMDPLQIRL